MKSLLISIALLFGFTAAATGKPVSGTVVWFDLRVSEFAKAEDFYGKLFGWQFQELFPGYKMISNQGKGIGGLSREQSANKENQGTMMYFQVESLRDSFNQALALGAREELIPTDIPGFGSYAIVRDLDNNQIALFSEKPLSANKTKK